jgi:MarR family transcriptional regulator, multiple antibiotic resistance protein MarR
MGTVQEPKVADAAYIEPDSIFRTLTRVRVEFLDALDRELAPFDITAAQYIVLKLVITGGVTSAAGLCRGIQYDPGAMTRMLDRLEQKGLIKRVQHADDRRKTMLAVTDDGKNVYPKLRTAFTRVQDRFLRGFSKSDVRALEGYLQRILANA